MSLEIKKISSYFEIADIIYNSQQYTPLYIGIFDTYFIDQPDFKPYYWVSVEKIHFAFQEENFDTYCILIKWFDGTKVEIRSSDTFAKNYMESSSATIAGIASFIEDYFKKYFPPDEDDVPCIIDIK